jgi:sensor histidine kinase regulating citrate/malate metabolism
MEPRGIVFFTFMNTSPVFKGAAVIIVGLVALGFSYWMVKRWKEPMSWQFMIFIGLSIFVVLYGLFILIFQPQWWQPPWW